MNQNDLNMLTDDWFKQTNAAEGVIQDAVKRAQDYAYQMGLERGQGNINKVILVLENMVSETDNFIFNKKNDEFVYSGNFEKAYKALEELLEELQESC
jgi:hypothetical protein